MSRSARRGLARARWRSISSKLSQRAAVRRRLRPIASQAAAVARLMQSRKRPLQTFVPRRSRGSFLGGMYATLRGRGGTGMYKRPRVGRVVRRRPVSY